MMETDRLRGLVCGSAKRAMEGQTPESLRAYSFAVDEGKRRILLRAHFDAAPTDGDIEAMSMIETEIDADFLDHFEGVTDIEIVAPGAMPAFLSGGIAYMRPVDGGKT